MASASVRPLNRRLRPERLGHDAIDADHQDIANCWFTAVNCPPLQFQFQIARLKKLMRSHFAREAAIMAHYDSALCACHEQDHNALLDSCNRAAQLSHHDWRKAQHLLRHEFPKMVRDHIICMDQMLVLFINTSSTVDVADIGCTHE